MLRTMILCGLTLALPTGCGADDYSAVISVASQEMQVSKNRTVFLIAHRFAPLKRANLILALEKGVVAERGTHEELVKQKGLYWSLYQRQQLSV